ncbi:MAG: hypothetical protein GH159_04055 [Dehalococcoidia bacterium]|nr:hypothetical protein [Dehalococcoidia bacterium]
MAKSQQEKILLGLSGEFAVASYLCLQGYVASLTLKNYPKVDIFVFNPRNDRNRAIQVKTKLGGREYFLPENISDTDPSFVFVEFATKDSLPEFFVVSAKRVAEISEWERQSWINAHPNAKKEQPRMISLSRIREFKDQWQNLGLD